MAGALPPARGRLVQEWTLSRRDELLADWALAVTGQLPLPIEPLRLETPVERVKAVRALADFKLLLVFTSGESRLFDARPFLHLGLFQTLQDPALFGQVRASEGTVCWPNSLDLCPDVLYARSTAVTPAEATLLLAPPAPQGLRS